MSIIRTPTKFDNFFVRSIPAMVLMVWLVGSIPVYSQVVGGSLSGTVSDESGAAIPEATVSISNVATGVTTNVTTNGQGIYNAPNLLPGNYQVTASAQGFGTSVQSGVILTVGAQHVLNMSMKVGTVTQRVEVTGEAQDVQLVNPTISGVISSNTIVELPLNGRSWTDLATLQPGVSSIRAIVSVSSTDRLGRGLGEQLSIAGGRPQQNTYLLDGININDYSNQAPGSILGGNLGADAVSEFTVLTTNYSTEYGRTSGGVISAITRSGTNQFHGSGYEFLRNSALDARNYFDLATIPAFRRNQFGASAGGPIRKDKTFIFGDYEGMRQNLGLSEQDQVPSLTARQGLLCNAPDCSTTTLLGVDPRVQPYLKFYPLPNGPVICPFSTCVPGAGDTANYSFAGSQITSENYFTTRVDQRFSNKDSLAGSYMYDKAPSSQNDEFNNKLILSQTRRQLVTLEETHLFSSSVVNTLRFGFNNISAAAPSGGKAINPLAANTSLGFTPGDTAGVIGVPGLTFFTGGVGATRPAVFHYHDFQVYDNVFLTKGIHSLKFGANVERIQDNQISSAAPDFEFGSLQDFLSNHPASFTSDGLGTITSRGMRETLLGAYLQDDIRVRPNLTINAGLRYELATVPSEIHGKLASLHALNGTQIFTGNPLFKNPSLRDFEPRVGFSWDPFRTGKSAVRGGFGMFDVQIFTPNLGPAVDSTAPFHLTFASANLPAFSFPTEAFSLISSSATSPQVAYVLPKRNYVMQWNLNVQREIAPNTTAMIAYVGSRGVHNLLRTNDASIVLPIKKTPLGYLWPIPNPTSPLPVLNPNFGQVSTALWISDSVFHALELEITKRMSHGLEAQVSYTYERSIDSSSGSTDGDQFLNGLSSLYFFDSRSRRGPSDFNVPQNLTVSYTWDIPSPQSASGVLRWASSGWELGGILQANSGTPFTPTIAPDPLGLNNTDPLDFPDVTRGCNLIHGGVDYLNLNCFSLPLERGPVVGKCSPFGAFASPAAPIAGTCANLMGNAGRNSIIGPALVNFDTSLFKDNPVKRISETFNAQFRVEMFNVLNHTNFNPPVANYAIFDGNGVIVPGAGQITSTATTSRQIQFALKLIW
jgi:hypothetical protein